MKDFYATLECTEIEMSMYAQRCGWGPGDTHLQYIGTSSTVRDLAALGGKIASPGQPINYWGFYYGTIVELHLINSEYVRSAIRIFSDPFRCSLMYVDVHGSESLVDALIFIV